MNENLKKDAINSLTRIEQCLGVTGENGGTHFDDDKEYFDAILKLPVADIRPFEELSDEQVTDKLAFILKKIRNNSDQDATTLLHLFAIQYAIVMISREFGTSNYEEIVTKAGATKSMAAEIRKGVSIFKKISEKYKIENNEKTYREYSEPNYTSLSPDEKYIAYNRIIFGAPGTGKSFQLKSESSPKDKPSPFAKIERVTFHPDYSYGQFVGSYKPVSDDEGKIRYEYVPGPFMRILAAALESAKNPSTAQKYLLIVEEINRAKVAAVFGDMFQLLDREDSGESVYEIQASEDVKKYLAKELGGTKDDYTSIKIPNNMYIWATMNSADQGVFPMDTAFKRRWEFTYLGIDANADKIKITTLPVKNNGSTVTWDELRKSINKMLLKECKVNEDKLLGPFFISGDVFEKAMSDEAAFYDAFNSKVLMYLFEDAGKMHVKKLFAGINSSELTFSKVCEEFKKTGVAVFGNTFALVQ